MDKRQLFSLLGLIGMGVFLFTPLSAQSLDRARMLEKAGDVASAFIEYRRLFENRRAHAPVALGLLRTGIATKNWREARRALRRYEQLQPNSDTAARLGVRLYFQQDQFDTALQWAKRYQNRRAGSWIPIYMTAKIQFQRQNYAETLDSLESARLRTERTPWIELLQIRARHRLEGHHDPERRQYLLENSNHPNQFFRLAQFGGIDWKPEDRADFLTRGLEFYPSESPLLGAKVLENDYRYRLALLRDRLDQPEQAREIMNPVSSERPSYRWLKASLVEEPANRLQAQVDVLTDHHDEIIFQWQHSRLARQVEGIQGTNRIKSSRFFHRSFENNLLFGYDESALSSLIRSLELQPTHARRQFDLAEYYHDRGWRESELSVLDRVEQLGLRFPTELMDYREGLVVDTDPTAPTHEIARIGIIINSETLWEGPPRGIKTLRNMIAHALHHQPAFEPDRVETPGDTPVAILMNQRNWDGAIKITVNDWEEAFEATLLYYLPENQIRERTFYARGRMKPWRFLHRVVTDLKDSWPWEGRVYRVEKPGAWVNLGRVHGLENDDPFQLNGKQRVIDEIHENHMRLRFPTPVLQGKIQRGMTAQRVLEETAGQ